MLAAIRFHDQARAEMHKIDCIRADLLLTPEFLAIQAMRPQMPPQRDFAVGQVLDERGLRNGSPLPLRERGWARGVCPGSQRNGRSPLYPALSREANLCTHLL